MNQTKYNKIIFSSDNFDKIENIDGFNFSVQKEVDNVVIKFKQTYSTNVFYFIYGNRYWLSFNEQSLADYLIEHNLIKGIINDKYNPSNKITTNKKYDKYSEVICEDNFFDSLELYKDHFNFNYCCDQILSVPIRDCGYIIQPWLEKYKQYISSLDSEDLIIELSAGFDTRTLTYFWRNTGKQYYIYTKNDSNEIDYAINVINKLPCKEYTSDKESPIKHNKTILSGASNISIDHYTNTYDFKNFIGKRRIPRIIDDIVPFYDKEYLKIKGDYVTQLKMVMNYMLCKPYNLHLLPYKTFMKKLFIFDENKIKECEEIIKYWNVTI